MMRPALTPDRPARRGFTLVELLVAISIFLVVSAMTVALVNNSRESDRLSGAARQVQSYVGGARDRAIYTVRTEEGPRNRGVRFLLDPNLPAIASMVYVESAGFFPPRRTVGPIKSTNPRSASTCPPTGGRSRPSTR